MLFEDHWGIGPILSMTGVIFNYIHFSFFVKVNDCWFVSGPSSFSR